MCAHRSWLMITGVFIFAVAEGYLSGPCGRGKFYVHRNYTCAECPNGTFMDAISHQFRGCKPCTKLEKTGPNTRVDQKCMNSADATFVCKPGCHSVNYADPHADVPDCSICDEQTMMMTELPNATPSSTNGDGDQVYENRTAVSSGTSIFPSSDDDKVEKDSVVLSTAVLLLFALLLFVGVPSACRGLYMAGQKKKKNNPIV